MEQTSIKEAEKLLHEYIQIEINYRMDCEVAFPQVSDSQLSEAICRETYRRELVAAKIHAEIKREQKLSALAQKLYTALDYFVKQNKIGRKIE